MKAKQKKKEPTIEESLDELDELLKKMEDEETGLEETFRLYEEGIEIVKRVNEGIDRVEKKVEVLSGDPDDKEDQQELSEDGL